VNNNGWAPRRHVRDHLKAIHPAELSKLTDAQLEKNDLFVCRESKDELFVSLTTVNNPVRKNHNPTRSLNNLQLVEQFIIRDLEGSYDSEWQDGLVFLSDLNPQPPTFRQPPLTTKLRWRLKQSVTSTFLSVVKASNETLKPPEHPHHIDGELYDSWPILQLQILFEQLILFPINTPSDNPQSSKALNATIHERLRKFKQGKIRELYEESRQVRSKTPKQQAKSPVKVQRAAQVAADLDNFKSANARVTKHAPVALINESNIHVLHNLHPPSLERRCIKPRVSTHGADERGANLLPQPKTSSMYYRT
jgi:hypothetical protein